jgi:hypothetical protein
MWQMRGTCLAIWDDLLPPVPEQEWISNLRQVAQALAADGGRAFEPTRAPTAEPGAG